MGARHGPNADLLGFVDVNQDFEIRTSETQDVKGLHLSANFSLLNVYDLSDAARRIHGLLADL
jgi:hypothetical protein